MLFLIDETRNFGPRSVRQRIYSCNEDDFKNIYNCLDFVIQEFQTAVNDQDPDHFKLNLSRDIHQRIGAPETYRGVKVFEIVPESTTNKVRINYSTSFAKNDREDSFNKSLNDVCSRRKRCLQRILSKEEADNQDHIRYTIDELIRIMRRDVDDDDPAHYKLALGCYVHRKLDFPKKYKDIRVIQKTFSSLHDCANLEIRLTYDPNFVDYSSSVRVAKKHTLEEWKKAVKNYYKDESTPRINIKEILIDGPATIIFWDNGSKTVVKRDKQHDKKDNRREALILAILKQTNTSSYKIAKLYSNPNKDKRTLAEYLLRKNYPWNEDYGRKWLNNTVKLIKEQTNAGFSHVRIVFRDNKQPEIFVREVKI